MTKANLEEVHGTSAPVFVTVYIYVNEFKRGRISKNDQHRSERPMEASSSDMVLDDRQIRVSEIVELHHKGQSSQFCTIIRV